MAKQKKETGPQLSRVERARLALEKAEAAEAARLDELKSKRVARFTKRWQAAQVEHAKADAARERVAARVTKSLDEVDALIAEAETLGINVDEIELAEPAPDDKE